VNFVQQTNSYLATNLLKFQKKKKKEFCSVNTLVTQ